MNQPEQHDRDDRGNLPSASGAPQWVPCPASFAAQRGMPDDGDSAPAAAGGKLHDVMEGRVPFESLEHDEQRLVGVAQALLAEVAEAQLPADEPLEDFSELRWWIRREPDLMPVASARVDRAYFAKTSRKLVIVEYKFGWLAVGDATENQQVRVQAVAGAEETGATEVIVAIIQPRAEREHRLTMCRYDADALRAARAEVVAAANMAVTLANDHGKHEPVYHSGAWCRYCRFRTRCVAAGEAVATAAGDPVAANTLAPEELARRLELAVVADAVIEGWRAEAAERLRADPAAIPGWKLPAPKPRREITDVQETYNRLNGIISADAMLGACKLSITSLEDVWCEQRPKGVTKKAAIEGLKERLGDLVTVKMSESRTPVRT